MCRLSLLFMMLLFSFNVFSQESIYKIMDFELSKNNIGNKYKLTKDNNEDGIIIKKWIEKYDEKTQKDISGYEIIKNNEKEDLMFEYKTKEGVCFCIKCGEKELFKYDKNSSENKFECTSTMGENTPTLEDVINEKTFEVRIEKNVAIANIDKTSYDLIKANGKAEDYGQLIGELLWYGRVIYTNGHIWKYLEIENFDLIAGKRKDMYKKSKNTEKDDVEENLWCNKFNNVSFQVKETPLITIDDSTTEIEWEDFKTTLRNLSKDWNKTCKEKHNE